MKGVFLFLISAFSTANGFAQKEITNWFFGYGAGLNFNNNTPVFEPNGQTQSWEGCATISDRNGNLLFYSDGIRVWDKTHSIMPNGGDLLGDTIATQAVLIVPFPGSDYLYYVFTVNAIETSTGDLRYSVVDLRLNNGKGNVTAEKNILLTSSACEKITAVRHENANDVWIITHLFGTNIFNVYLINCRGLNPVPQQFSIGNIIAGRVGNAIGYLKASPDGKKLAMASFLSMVEVFDFDNTSGLISNARQIGNNPGICAPYGIEFSPDNKLLYVTEVYDCGATGNYKILQYNTEAADITTSMITLESAYGSPPGALQLGQDDKIYIAFSDAAFIGVINNPDIYGPGSTYIKEYISLQAPAKSGLGLPSFVAGMHKTVLGNNFSVCEGTDTSLIITISNTSVIWQDGSVEKLMRVNTTGNYAVSINYDGCSYTDTIYVEFREKPVPDLGMDKALCEYHFPITLEQTIPGAVNQWQDGSVGNNFSVRKDGLYWVQATVNGCTGRDSINIAIHPNPVFSLGKDTGICEGSALFLSAGIPGSYLWNTGNTSQSVITSQPGTYWCTVTNQFGCTSTDSINAYFLPGPDFTLGNDEIICNNRLMLDVSSAGTSFRWQDQSTSPRFVVDKSGTYWVQVTKSGCTQSDTVTYVFKSVPVPFLGADQQLCPGDELVLDPGPMDASILWSDGNRNRITKINAAGRFTITATNECGSGSDEIIIKPGGCSVPIPNAFTPSKSRNNIFRVANSRVLNGFRLQVYNRWGQQLYSSNDPAKGWDGTFHGSLQLSGTYAYVIHYIDPVSLESVVKKGTVLLIR